MTAPDPVPGENPEPDDEEPSASIVPLIEDQGDEEAKVEIENDFA